MADALRFVLNGEEVTITDLSASTTLLTWLRYRRALTGTKEGCAEGDCGACTVAVRSLGPDGVITRPINACIQTLGMLHGKDIVTVEHLASPDATLHPIQQAMASGHASQCGFCTPGFVMSLWASGRSGGATSPDALNAMLAGNLCRCTGYGPILDAARASLNQPAPQWEESDAVVEARLAALPQSDALDYTARSRRFIAPVTLDDLAARIAEHPGATILSGATDIGLWMTKHAFDPAVTIYTGRVDALRAVTETSGVLSIGAGATYAEAAPALTRNFPDIGALIRRIGGAQVRAAGTIGGNIANGSPIGDMPPALIAAGATLTVRCGAERRELPLAEFFVAYGRQDLDPGAFVEAIHLPVPDDPHRLRCYKISKRFDQDITAVLGCFDVAVETGTVTAARLAFGGMAGIPKRAGAAERSLVGQPWTRASVEAAMDALVHDFEPLSDMRASAAYRMQTARNLLLKYFIERTQPEILTRIDGDSREIA